MTADIYTPATERRVSKRRVFRTRALHHEIRLPGHLLARTPAGTGRAQSGHERVRVAVFRLFGLFRGSESLACLSDRGLSGLHRNDNTLCHVLPVRGIHHGPSAAMVPGLAIAH